MLNSQKTPPYFAQTGELWGVFCEYLSENWPRYNGTALYFVEKIDVHFSLKKFTYQLKFGLLTLTEQWIMFTRPLPEPLVIMMFDTIWWPQVIASDNGLMVVMFVVEWETKFEDWYSFVIVYVYVIVCGVCPLLFVVLKWNIYFIDEN